MKKCPRPFGADIFFFDLLPADALRVLMFLILFRFLRWGLGLGAALILVVACQADTAPTPYLTPTPGPIPVSDTPIPYPTSTIIEATPSSPLKLQGQFVFSPGDGSLWLQDLGSGTTRALAERSLKELSQLPAFSPDGKQIAYATLVFMPGGIVRGDLRVMNLETKVVRTIVQAEAANVFYVYPRWTRDGKTLLITRATNLSMLDEHADLETVKADGTAGPQMLLKDARDADISPDNQQIVFVRVAANGINNSLWLAKADGSAPQQLVAEGIFSAIMSPRFAPDSQRLAFSVHGTPQKQLPWAYHPSAVFSQDNAQETDSCFFSLLFTCLIETASAHGAPGAIWRVDLKSPRFDQLTPIYNDSPTPAWSADGNAIAIQDVTTIRLIDLVRKEIYVLDAKHGGTGGFDWRQ